MTGTLGAYGALATAGGNAPTVTTPQKAGPAQLVIHNEIGGRALDTHIIDTVTGVTRRELR